MSTYKWFLSVVVLNRGLAVQVKGVLESVPWGTGRLTLGQSDGFAGWCTLGRSERDPCFSVSCKMKLPKKRGGSLAGWHCGFPRDGRGAHCIATHTLATYSLRPVSGLGCSLSAEQNSCYTRSVSWSFRRGRGPLLRSSGRRWHMACILHDLAQPVV